MMRNILLTIALVCFLAGGITAQPKLAAEIQFVTLGNCAICKIRIESKLALTGGVISADWDYNNDVTTVVYDDQVTDAFQIMQAIADTGHDTEWYRAPDSLYALLIGSCCEYERTINYSNVQIGYLSLMGIWVYPVGVSEIKKSCKVSIYPSIGSGVVTVDVKESRPDQDAVLAIYSISGRKVFQDKLAGRQGNTLDLTFLSNGKYVAVVTSGNEIVYKSNLIIIH